MTIRLVFTPPDLRRVRIADGPDPMWELTLSLHQLRACLPPARYRVWSIGTGQSLRHDPDATRWLPLLCTLVPEKGDFADFLTPSSPLREWEAGCEAIACLSRDRIRGDLASAFAHRPVPGWIRQLGDGDRAQRRALISALSAAHRTLISPYWSRLQDSVAPDRTHRLGVLARGGVDALLLGLPGVRGWDGRTLDVAYPVTRTVELNGRGLTLVPSYFCTENPVCLIDPALPPVLVYPAEESPVRAAIPVELSPRLIALLGRTRAACLLALREPRTTSSLAKDLGVSVGTASKQATVLREAGLLCSQRDGAAVVHALTTLGTELITGAVRQQVIIS